MSRQIGSFFSRDGEQAAQNNGRPASTDVSGFLKIDSLRAAGVLLAAAYALEWSHWVHSTAGFAVAWGAFPVLVGYWAQTESLSPAVVVVAAAATALSMSQRVLSKPARHVRRVAADATADAVRADESPSAD